MEKSKKVPAWFIETRNQAEDLEKELSKETSLSRDEMINKAKDKTLISFLKSKLTIEKMGKMQFMITAASHLVDYSWARYRAENYDNEFGQAESLHYNKKEQTMEIGEKPNDKNK